MLGWVERIGLVVELAALIVPTNPMRMPPKALAQSLSSEASCSLNRHSENALYKELIIAGKVGGDSPSSCVLPELPGSPYADRERLVRV